MVYIRQQHTEVINMFITQPGTKVIHMLRPVYMYTGQPHVQMFNILLSVYMYVRQPHTELINMLRVCVYQTTTHRNY